MNRYRTSSLPLAAYLCSKDGVTFVGVNKENLSTIAFIFKPIKKVQKLADDYFAGQATVNPLELFKNYRALKDLIFEAKRSSEQNFGGTTSKETKD